MGMDKPLDTMSLDVLMECSLREMTNYRHKMPSDDSYCLEILRRAINQRDNKAWELLRRQFNDNVHIWLNGHSHKELALRYESEQTYIDDAFRRFWQAVSDQSMSFNTVAGALSYLRLCLHCAVMDTLRAFARTNIEQMPENGHPAEPQTEDKYHESELWQTIRDLLPSEKERRVAFLHFHCNLKPREIIRFCPGEFQNEEEIYRLKRNIMERIMRNTAKIRWKLGDSITV
jgi:hypothetical protein